VSSPTDPIDVTEFTKAEIAAAVAAAASWSTYVTVHGYPSRAINQAIDAGAKVIDHGRLLDKKTLDRMAKEGAWLSFQPSPSARSRDEALHRTPSRPSSARGPRRSTSGSRRCPT